MCENKNGKSGLAGKCKNCDCKPEEEKEKKVEVVYTPANGQEDIHCPS